VPQAVHDGDITATARSGADTATSGSGIMQMQIDIPIEMPLTEAATDETRHAVELKAVAAKGERSSRRTGRSSSRHKHGSNCG